MPSERIRTVRLKVIPADYTSEITVTRGTELIAQEQGLLERDLPLGLYTVTARVGFGFDAKNVALDGSDAEVRLPFPVVSVHSPAPLNHTKQLRAEHATAAKRESQKVHVRVGTGSSIFVFARDWREGTVTRAPDLLKGVRLRSFHDDKVLADLQAAGLAGARSYPWAACNIEVNPGAYRLTVDLEPGERLSQTVVATLGWQTQLFMFPHSTHQLIDLNTAAVLLCRRDRRSAAFNPDDADLRMVELARYALATNSPALLAYVRERIEADKPLHPMVAIFAAQQFIASRNGERQIVAAITADLITRGFADHPDVMALALSLDSTQNVRSVSIPPMLRRSLDLLLRTTVRRPDMIPTDALVGRVGMRIWGEEPWLVWRESPASDASNDAPEPLAIVKDNLQAQLRRLGADWKTIVRSQQWLLEQVVLLGVPRRQLEELLDELGASDPAVGEPVEWDVAIRMQRVPTYAYSMFRPEETPLLKCQVRAARRMNVRVRAYIEGYAGEDVNTQWLEAGETHTFSLKPPLRVDKIATLTEIVTTKVNVKLDDLQTNRVLKHQTFDVTLYPPTTVLLAVEDPHTKAWSDMSPYVATFVTPKAAAVQAFVRRAADRMPGKRLVGYQSPIAPAETVEAQVRAIVETFKQLDIAYTSFVKAFGSEPGVIIQSVQLPSESLENKLANCIDGQVLLASALEAIGLEAALVYIQEGQRGHALVAWETQAGSGDWRYLDTTDITTDTFENVTTRATNLARAFESATTPRGQWGIFRRWPLSILRNERNIWPTPVSNRR